MSLFVVCCYWLLLDVVVGSCSWSFVICCTMLNVGRLVFGVCRCAVFVVGELLFVVSCSLLVVC